jgi:L-threonylcarbamoyladenylate synthase
MGRVWRWREEEAGAIIKEAGRLLAAGAVLAVPTETFYALAVHPFKEEALARLFALKERPEEKPVLILISGPEMLGQVVREVPAAAQKLMARFWPGPLTVIFPAREDLPRLLTGSTGTIAVRQPRQDVTLRLLAALGFPLTGTSANRAGRPALAAAAEVAAEFGLEVELIIDAGLCPGGLPSTIVDAASTPPRIVRPGAIDAATLQEIWETYYSELF